MTSRTTDWWHSVAVSVAPADAPAAFCSDLGAPSLLAAYRAGLFPMPAPDEYARWMNEALYEDRVATGAIAVPGHVGELPYQVSWWSPDPRPVIRPGHARLGRRLARRLRNRLDWATSVDRDFGRVVAQCGAGREPRWLTEELRRGLQELHEQGWAHSVEVWQGAELVGGAFGVRAGPVLSLDSMFHRLPDASRVAVADLGDRFTVAGGLLLDVQWDSPHIRSLGARPLPRDDYLDLLRSGPPAGPPSTELLPAARLA
ncbi:leucyl/phenylalanyl-tRNA--protein transferase [Kitasatospora sp. MBT63]|uniref:leucyl/phenylalanyl-tRNA--protein transferase n=1 Tax=Kitasatospora sp. MBT63 TaxID=1444768 RepID=UPI00053974B2|nr:leucyl/phenylalanyl-tRNA--protein transferase [Kitasatospora sp. MBT63]